MWKYNRRGKGRGKEMVKMEVERDPDEIFVVICRYEGSVLGDSGSHILGVYKMQDQAERIVKEHGGGGSTPYILPNRNRSHESTIRKGNR